jgi:hypothetical protein
MYAMILTDEERALTRNAFHQGPAALIEAGFTPEEMGAFLRRPEVVGELNLLTKEFEEQKHLGDRAKFMARRNLSRLVNGATAVLARSLAGPRYARDNKGQILLDARGHPVLVEPETTPIQLRAAESVLDKLGVADQKGVFADVAGDVNVTLMLQAAEETMRLDDDPELVTDEQRALSREKVRNIIELLMPEVDDARKKALPGPKKAKKKASKKKSTKKVSPSNNGKAQSEEE